MRGTAPWELDQEQAELFPRFGYSLGEGATVRTFVRYRFADERVDDPSAFSELFTEALDASFGRLLSETAGAQLAAMLSGGLDSRLLLVWLKRLGAENVLAFSYSSKGSEAAPAQAVAEQLEVPFHFVGLDAEGMREAWLRGCEFLTSTRRWYGGFVNDVYQHEGGQKAELYNPRMTVTKKLVESHPWESGLSGLLRIVGAVAALFQSRIYK